MTHKYLFLSAFLCLLVSCTIEPKPISYGNDHCHFCEMTIVDKNHSSFYVTEKGRQYNFDAIECMINDLDKKERPNLAFIEVAYYGHPNQMIKAQNASYLISEGIKSPMSANLSAFNSLESAQKAQQEHGGKIYSWSEIKAYISKK